MNERASDAPALWLRVLQFPATRILVLGGAVLYLMGWTEAQVESVKDTPVAAVAVAAALSLAGIALYVGWGRLVERRPVAELSLAGAGREWLAGALVGAGLYTGCVVMLMVLGIYRIEGLNPLSFLIPALAMSVKSSVFEEMIFRGILFRSVEELAGSWIAILVSSAVFGLIHLTNPGATLTGAVYISVEAGLLLAAAYLVTRRLWIAMGFHFAWNYVQSAVFSGAVSGNAAEPGLLQDRIEGPTFLTGGSFGMEQSVFALLFCTSAGIVMLVMAIRRGHLRPPPWSRKG